MVLSDHARKRMQQRATNPTDVETIMVHGTQVRDGYLLRKRDVAEEISRLKSKIRKLERLKNRVVISDRKTIITVYPASKRKQKQLLNLMGRRERRTE